MRKIVLLSLVLALVAAAGPQISAFFDYIDNKWITYVTDDEGNVYSTYDRSGPMMRHVGKIPGPGPYDISAFFDGEDNNFVIYVINGDGEVYRLQRGEFNLRVTIPGPGPFSLSAFHDTIDDEYIVNALNGEKTRFRLQMGELSTFNDVP